MGMSDVEKVRAALSCGARARAEISAFTHLDGLAVEKALSCIPPEERIMTTQRDTTFGEVELLVFARRVHQTARDKGWWGESPEDRSCSYDLDEKLYLIQTELAEAFEEYRNPKVDVTKIYYHPSEFVLIERGWALSSVGTQHSYNVDGSTISDGMLAEALKGKPEGFPIEMADALIRILDLLGGAGKEPLAYSLQVEGNTKLARYMRKIVHWVNSASEASLQDNLSEALMLISTCCRDMNVDLRTAAEVKADFNDTRPARHGGKRA